MAQDELSIPVIDLKGLPKDGATRIQVIGEIRNAAEKWGFFQMVNHGIPESVMAGMIHGVRSFHEQDDEQKLQYSGGGLSQKVIYNPNVDGGTPWRDTILVSLTPDPPKPEELPHICRGIMIEYTERIKKLGHSMLELLSEALELNPNHLKNMGCAEAFLTLSHYYRACPEPERITFGLHGHTDSGTLTILQQDKIGGLQALHNNQWVDVPFVPGALVVNIADLLQLITNDKFKSVYHRVLLKSNGPRISVACFFRAVVDSERLYGPINELLSKENPTIYKAITIKEMVSQRANDGIGKISPLSAFRLRGL